MAEYIAPCIYCLGRDICKRNAHNAVARISKIVTTNEPGGNRLAYRLVCDEYSSEYLYGHSGSCSGTQHKSRFWYTDDIPCAECRFKELCNVDFAKQSAFCVAVSRELEGTIEFSCSAFERKKDEYT